MNSPANRRSQSRVSAKRSTSTANSKTKKATTVAPEVPVAEPSTEVESTANIAPEVPVAEPSTEVESTANIALEVPVTEPSTEVESTADIAPEVPVAEPSTEVESTANIAPEVPVAEPSTEVESTANIALEVPVAEPSTEVESTADIAPEVPVAEPSTEVESTAKASRQTPISPPGHPRQYRAIGLVLGKFEASEDNLNQGILQTTDGVAIETVLLGRMISLVKKHLDLTKPHLWVVYPRSRQEDDKLHLQISGVWEPQTLHPQETTEATGIQIENGYFSIRGEVVFYSLEKETVIVKIRQSPKKQGEKPKFFKLRLKGSLPGRPLRNFWDIQVQLQEEALTIVSGTDLGPASKRKPFNKDDKKPWSKQPRKLSDGTYAPPFKPKTDSRTSFERPIKKRDIQKDN